MKDTYLRQVLHKYGILNEYNIDCPPPVRGEISTLKSKVERLSDDVYEVRQKLDLIMDHLGLERELDDEPRLKKKEECS